MTTEKMQVILDLVEEYIKENVINNEWKKGEDWVTYSGPNLSEKEFSAAVKSLLGGWLILGEEGRNFELEFAKHMRKKHGCVTNSGSSANLLMMSAFTSNQKSVSKYKIPKGSKIITPVVCFPTTINPIIQCGFEPLFVDVDLPSANLNLDQVEELLKNDKDREIRAITFAHVLGNPPDMDRLMKLVKEYNLIFLEDTCDALGSTYDGKKLGSFGHVSTCSFFPAHHMTMGEGGFVATSDPRLRRVIASFRDWGRACYCNEQKPGCVVEGTACGDRFQEWLTDGEERITYDHRYVFNEIGYNIKPLELQAAIGLEQINKLPEMDQARRDNFEKLMDIFRPYEKYLMLPEATPNSDPCWFGYLIGIREDAGFKKRDLVSYLEMNKIQTRSYFTGNVLYHPGYRHLVQGGENLVKKYPNANFITRNAFFLGTYKGLTDEKLEYIKEIIDQFFEEEV